MIGDDSMNETQLYKELGTLTRSREKWEDNIPYVSALLSHESVKIQAKALWLLGEMGLAYPQSVKAAVPAAAAFLQSTVPLLRERAINALGRIGRADFELVRPYLAELFRFACDDGPKVRLSFIWASENIAVNTPDIFKDHMQIYAQLLHDTDTKVRMEAPEIFRVLGKRRPEFVLPFVGLLENIAESDENRVVKIHCMGAVKEALLSKGDP